MNPIDPDILASNNAFAQLHSHLLASLLTPNSETALLANSASRQDTFEGAKRNHVRRAQTYILSKALNAVACDGSNRLNSAVRERCLLVAALLGKGVLTREERRLIEPDLEQFRSDLVFDDGAGLARLLLQDLEGRGDTLHEMVLASRSTSSATAPASLTASLQESISSLEALKQFTVPKLHANLAESMSQILALYRELMELQIQQLERHTHGIQLRSIKAQAEYLSTVSTGMAAKARLLLLQARQEIYDDEVQEALESYGSHLSVLRERLGERHQQLEEETRLFEEQGERRMRECGRRYTAVTKDIEDAKAEIARLKPDRR